MRSTGSSDVCVWSSTFNMRCLPYRIRANPENQRLAAIVGAPGGKGLPCDGLPSPSRRTLFASAMPTGSVMLRLLLAAGLGAALGLEREDRRKPAGLRTNML